MELSKPERAKIAVRYIAKKLNKSQQDVGVMLGYPNKAYFSAVLNGKARYFTDNLAPKIVLLEPSINLDFLKGESDQLLVGDANQPAIPEMVVPYATEQTDSPAKTGVYVPKEFMSMLGEMSATIRSQQETIHKLVDDITQNNQ